MHFATYWKQLCVEKLKGNRGRQEKNKIDGCNHRNHEEAIKKTEDLQKTGNSEEMLFIWLSEDKNDLMEFKSKFINKD